MLLLLAQGGVGLLRLFAGIGLIHLLLLQLLHLLCHVLRGVGEGGIDLLERALLLGQAGLELLHLAIAVGTRVGDLLLQLLHLGLRLFEFGLCFGQRLLAIGQLLFQCGHGLRDLVFGLGNLGIGIGSALDGGVQGLLELLRAAILGQLQGLGRGIHHHLLANSKVFPYFEL